MNEKYPENWVSLNLMVNKDNGEFHVVSGDKLPGEGDTPYIGLEVLNKRLFSVIKPQTEKHNARFMYRVWIEQVNQTFVDVYADSTEEAMERAYKKWRKEDARSRISYVEKNGEQVFPE